MATPTMIIDGKDHRGKRLSISVDKALWALFVASHGGDAGQARRVLKHQMSIGLVANTYQAKCLIYRLIAKPDLLTEDFIAAT